MKAVKITNPFYIQYAAPEINKYVEKIKQDGITYESFVAFLQQVAQFGGNLSELWMVIEGKYPVAFMQFNVMGFPYIGTCSLNHVASWTNDKKAFDLLLNEFMNFAVKNNCTVGIGSASNRKLSKYYKNKSEGVGYEYKTTGATPFSCIKMKVENENIPRDKD